jgi:transposase
VRVRASASQAAKLAEWAAGWPERTWAVEGAAGLGHLLAQQLLAAGEQVLDIQPKLGSRVRLLSSGSSNKNDPNDARSVAIAALRSPVRKAVAADDHAVVLKMWSKRHRDLARLRAQAACRLHATVCELIPGGVSKRMTTPGATALLASLDPSGPVAAARHELALAQLDDLRRIDDQLRQTRAKLTIAVRARGTSLTEIFGVGPVIAATIIGDAGDISRFPARTGSPPTTAPPRSRSRPGTVRPAGCPGAATGA